MEVAGASRRWRWPFRCRGSRPESAVAQLGFVRLMSDIRQLRLARWESIRQGGIWRFVLLRGVLGWGIPMGVIGVVFELVSSKAEALPWYLIFGLSLAGGFVWGFATWFVTMWIYTRALKSR